MLSFRCHGDEARTAEKKQTCFFLGVSEWFIRQVMLEGMCCDDNGANYGSSCVIVILRQKLLV